jgi:hypothetical protein
LRLILLLVVAILLLIFASFYSRSLGLGGAGVLVIILIARVTMDFTEAKERRLFKLERRAARGAKGEEDVARILDALNPNEYLVLHDIASPYGNIDHIVIGKHAGIFLIETKAHGGKVTIESGQVLVNSRVPEKDFIAQALRNTYWLRDILRQELATHAWIMPVLVFTNAFVPKLEPVKGVQILNKRYLLALLQLKYAPLPVELWQSVGSIQKILKVSCEQR